MRLKTISYFCEYSALRLFLGVCALLPWQRASSLGGWLGRFLGPKLKGVHRRAIRNIRAALDKTQDEAHHIAMDMWDNLGRTIAEYPHLQTIARNHTVLRNAHYLEAVRDDDQPAIFFGAHMANFELLPIAVFNATGLKIHSVYRAPNNPFVDKLLLRYRSYDGALNPFPKSREGLIAVARAMKQGEHIGMLIDQKYNEGVDADFFGMTARTSTAFIDLAQKYDCPMLTARWWREKDGFVIDVQPPLSLADQSKNDILETCHRHLEQWIKDYPAQWLWTHRRWRDDDLKDISQNDTL